MNAQINSNMHNTWINVTVGVVASAGRDARCVLANPNGSVGELAAARTGTVFAAPVSFSNLYHSYADMGVPSKVTLRSPCGDRISKRSSSKPF